MPRAPRARLRVTLLIEGEGGRREAAATVTARTAPARLDLDHLFDDLIGLALDKQDELDGYDHDRMFDPR